MSGRDERPRHTLTFVQAWPVVLEKLKARKIEEGWTEIEYIYCRMMAKWELVEEIACQE